MLDVIFDEEYYILKKKYKKCFTKVQKDIEHLITNIY